MAEGLGADTCITECRTHEDVAASQEDALDDFVEDKSENEPSGKGGEAMEEVYEEHYGNGTIADCVPEYDPEGGQVAFEDVDSNADGLVSADEAIAFGEKMCVSDEMTMQIFDMADADQDKELTPEEWDSVGEESAAEEAIDKAVDSVSEGDQEYSEVKPPYFDDIDADGDGVLSKEEAEEALMLELSRRFPGKSQEELEEMAAELEDEMWKKLDTDGDGVLSKEEWEAPEQGTPENLGSEIGEAAAADENAEDPDDLPTAEQSEVPSSPAPAVVAFHVRPMAGRHRRGGKAKFHRATPKTGGPLRSFFLRKIRSQRGRGAAIRRGGTNNQRLRPAAHLVAFRRQHRASKRGSRGERPSFWQAVHALRVHGAKADRGGARGLRLRQVLRSMARRNLLAREAHHSGHRHYREA